MRPPRIIGLALPLLATFLAGCSPSPGADEPPPLQVRRELARMLADTEHLQLTDFRQTDEEHYAAEAKGPRGATYQVDVTVKGRTLSYKAEGKDRYLGGRMELPEPSFDEKHPQVVQALRGLALIVQAGLAVWVALGRFGRRRVFSPRVETGLALFGAANAGFAIWWGYQIALNWGVA